MSMPFSPVPFNPANGTMPVPVPVTFAPAAPPPAASAPAASAPAAAPTPDALDAAIEQQVAASAVSNLESLLEAALAVNLDEVVATAIPVTIMEWQDVPQPDPAADPDAAAGMIPAASALLTRRKRVARHTEIDSYVPMRLFNEMVAEQQQARRDQQAGKVIDPQAAILRAVWRVWQLSEPDMTLNGLQDGLSFGQVMGLYSRFFGAELRLMTSRAPSAANSSPAPAS